jgi:hypothetical protein
VILKSTVFYGAYKSKDKPLYNLKKFTVWVVRAPNDKVRQAKMENVDSAPCAKCTERLKKLGFGRIAFSNSKGEMEIHKLATFQTNHLSRAQRLTMNKIRNIGRRTL